MYTEVQRNRYIKKLSKTRADEIPAGSKTDFRDSKKSLIDNPPKICFNI